MARIVQRVDNYLVSLILPVGSSSSRRHRKLSVASVKLLAQLSLDDRHLALEV